MSESIGVQLRSRVQLENGPFDHWHSGWCGQSPDDLFTRRESDPQRNTALARGSGGPVVSLLIRVTAPRTPFRSEPLPSSESDTHPYFTFNANGDSGLRAAS